MKHIFTTYLLGTIPALGKGITAFAILASLALAGASSSCQRKNEAKERIQAEREKWEASLPDSLKAVERQQDSIRAEIDVLAGEMEKLLPGFDYVDNPREVEGYYIAKAWRQTYPLQKTGLRARLTKGEQLELIATLAGGAHFDRMRVETSGNAAETSVVAHDQALNYRMAGLTTVCFSDSAASECARLIAEATAPVRIIYLEGGRTAGQIDYPASDAAVMKQTWDLYETRRSMTRDEHMIPLLARKAAIISARIDRINKDK